MVIVRPYTVPCHRRCGQHNHALHRPPQKYNGNYSQIPNGHRQPLHRPLSSEMWSTQPQAHYYTSRRNESPVTFHPRTRGASLSSWEYLLTITDKIKCKA
ncbi:hypothetical protein AVEN_168501-1 [Araneus ventricosus]|uniref:Uncharacterized protein n=1 Tax=Araneus ventricosus TaxID=182803 RepID=A0A4Y2VBB7_ARAVE|nr:hypothetical protein AVEN_181228-1 [Araneus ventricosus]GBO21687.1 hypothetical protein AVEN_168501-1 [Araneus ventricosus]